MRKTATVCLVSLAGGAVALAASALLTLVLSLAIALGLHPEAAVSAEWAAAVVGVLLGGAVVRRAGSGASVGAGVVVGLTWALTWLYLVGRFDPHLWRTEALPAMPWRYPVIWAAAPALGALGGALAMRCRKPGVLLAAAPVVVLLVAFANLQFTDRPGHYALGQGAAVTVQGPDREGTTVRLLSFDFARNPRLRIGVYDCDSDDSHPFDDTNTSYFGTPALSVFDKLGPGALCVVNAGFFGWSKTGRVGMHVAPVVQDGTARYDKLNGPDIWTFGWKMKRGTPEFRLLKGVSFSRLAREFDTALSHVRPLVVDGRALKLGPGAGVTRLRCSRTSLGWSPGSSKLYLLVVRDPDSELSSIGKWENGETQTGGWDLPQVQRFWTRVGVKNALALDGGDSTQLVYRGPNGRTDVGSARLSVTLGFLRDRPVRIWIPILPTRHCDAGVMNYFYLI